MNEPEKLYKLLTYNMTSTNKSDVVVSNHHWETTNITDEHISFQNPPQNCVWTKPKRNRYYIKKKAEGLLHESVYGLNVQHINNLKKLKFISSIKRNSLSVKKITDDIDKINKHIPIAYNSEMSLLKLAQKLNFAKQKLHTKTKSSFLENANASLFLQKCEDIQQVKPLELPTIPKQAVNILQSLKFIKDDNPSKLVCDTIPLWPVLSAVGESAFKIDTSYLDSYTQEPSILSYNNSNVTRSGRQVNAPRRLIEKVQSEETEMNIDDSCSTAPNLSHISQVPDFLSSDEHKSIEKYGISTIINTYLPRVAKKAYHETKKTLDSTKAAITECVNSVKTKESKVFQQSNIRLETPIKSQSSVIKELLKGCNSHIDTQTETSMNDSCLQNVSNVNSTENVQNSHSSVIHREPESDLYSAHISFTSAGSKNKSPVQTDGKYFENAWSAKKQKHTLDRKYQCLQCNYRTDNRSHLRRHESSVHSGDKMYNCYVCKKEFARSEKCKSHIMTTHPEIPYDPRFIRKDRFQSRQAGNDRHVKLSPEQNGKTSNHANAVMHASTERHKKQFRNKSTEDISTKENELTTKSEQVPEEEIIFTDILPEVSDSYGKYGNAENIETFSKVYKCQICFYEGKDAWHLKRHVSDVHNNKKAFRCRKCNYVTSRKHRLISHMKNHGELYCIYCDFKSKDYLGFQVHLKECTIQRKARSLTCEHCKQAFFNRKIYSDHMWRYHNQELYCCELCHFTSIDINAFELHEREHFKVDCSSTCNTCKVSFDAEKQCEEHVLQFHNTDDTFVLDEKLVKTSSTNSKKVCLLCGFTSLYAAVIKNHLDMHTRNMHACEMSSCYFTAYTKKQMAIHMKEKHFHSKNSNSIKQQPETNIHQVTESANPQDLTIKHQQLPESNSLDSACEKITFHSGKNLADQDNASDMNGHGSGIWKCSYCPNNPPFRYRRSFEKHLTKHFGGYLSSNETFDRGEEYPNSKENVKLVEICPVCELKFDSKVERSTHMQEVHATHLVESSGDETFGDTGGMMKTQMWLKQHSFHINHDFLPDDVDDNCDSDSNDGITPIEWL